MPKKILVLMGVQGLTRDNVTSHLQVRVGLAPACPACPGLEQGLL
jgi:hypothetical protein